jgi:hypothetical protein
MFQFGKPVLLQMSAYAFHTFCHHLPTIPRLESFWGSLAFVPWDDTYAKQSYKDLRESPGSNDRAKEPANLPASDGQFLRSSSNPRIHRP